MKGAILTAQEISQMLDSTAMRKPQQTQHKLTKAVHRRKLIFKLPGILAFISFCISLVFIYFEVNLLKLKSKHPATGIAEGFLDGGDDWSIVSGGALVKQLEFRIVLIIVLSCGIYGIFALIHGIETFFTIHSPDKPKTFVLISIHAIGLLCTAFAGIYGITLLDSWYKSNVEGTTWYASLTSGIPECNAAIDSGDTSVSAWRTCFDDPFLEELAIAGMNPVDFVKWWKELDGLKMGVDISINLYCYALIIETAATVLIMIWLFLKKNFDKIKAEADSIATVLEPKIAQSA